MKARYYSPDQKSALLEEWRESGLSAKVFSKDKPFSPGCLFYWNRKDNSPKSVGFIEVSRFHPCPCPVSALPIRMDVRWR